MHNYIIIIRHHFKAFEHDITMIRSPRFVIHFLSFMGVNNIYSVAKNFDVQQYQAYNHLALGLSDYKTDIAFIV